MSDSPSSLPRIYTDLAGWYHLLTSPDEYGEEAEFYWACLVGANGGTPPTTMLELGSGGGNMALHYKPWVESVTLTDLSEDMLAISRSINPELEHVQGDMRTLRLGRTFDAVFVHDAIMYLTTEDDLCHAIETVSVHLRPGGVTVVAPDHIKETFKPSMDCGGHDGDDGRSLRYLEWTWDPNPNDTVCVTDFTYVRREDDGPATCFTERHQIGLFSREVWLRLLTEAGFTVTSKPLVHGEVEPGEVEIYVGVKRTVG